MLLRLLERNLSKRDWFEKESKYSRDLCRAGFEPSEPQRDVTDMPSRIQLDKDLSKCDDPTRRISTKCSSTAAAQKFFETIFCTASRVGKRKDVKNIRRRRDSQLTETRV